MDLHSSSSSSSLLCFFLFLLYLLAAPSYSLPLSVSIPLSLSINNKNNNPSAKPTRNGHYPYQKLAFLVSQSLSRAHHLKTHRNDDVTSLSSHTYGGYSISLNFGSPPQTIQFVMDTGSDLSWFPCTKRYVCRNCTFPGGDKSRLATPPFFPKLSSSSKVLGCQNPKCGWLHHRNVTHCADCASDSSNCTQICSPYMVFYGSGTTGGFGLLETLDLPGNRLIPDFLVGCSIFSSRQPAGIAGFGRGKASLPSQLGLDKFSYCLLSRKYDESSQTSPLQLQSGLDSGEKTAGVSYTRFAKNPVVPGKEALSVYYYLPIRKITVGGSTVEIEDEHMRTGENGDGGSIVDSGSTFTYMTNGVFKLVASAFENQVKKYSKAGYVESAVGLRPCFNVSGEKEISLPEMRLHFKGGAEMVLPLENYYVLAGNSEAVCFAVVTDSELEPSRDGGPAIILGSFQMQNFYVEYDLRNDRFGFMKQKCK